MKKIDLEALQKEALEHYDRMITWAEQQPHSAFADPVDMYAHIKETYFGSCCSYCRTFLNLSQENHRSRMNDEVHCPLVVWNDGDACCDSKRNCCNGLWGEMVNADTWKFFIEGALKVKEYIKENGSC